MKKIVFIVCMFVSVSLQAISESGTIDKDKNNVLNALLENLGLTSISKEKKDSIFNTFKHTLNKAWYASWGTNKTITSSKFGKSSTQIFDLNVVDENRVYIISYTYFSDQKQLHIVQREIIDGSSSGVIENYNKHKKNTDFEIKAEKDSYAYFQKKSLTQYLISHVKSPNGMNVYIDYKILDI